MDIISRAYRVGWLIDGNGTPATRDRFITVRGARIQAVIDDARALPPGTGVVDLTDCTILPALIDCHAHLVMSGATSSDIRRHQLNGTYADRCRVIAAHLHDHLRHGVAAVRDGGDHHGYSLRYRMDPANATRCPVVIAAPGRARHAAGRYGKLIGIPVADGMTLSASAFGQASARDHLKLVNSGLNSLSQFGVETRPQFAQAELDAVVRTARSRGLPVMVHANGRLPVKMAVAAGCSSIEHGFFMGRENMQRMRDRGVVWVPTAVTMQAYAEVLASPANRCDASFADVSRRNLEHQLEQIATARRMGLTLALGTDAGSPGVHHGQAVLTELDLYITAGYTVEAAIGCASRNGARLMGLNDRGVLGAGMRADFIAVEGSPERLPEALNRIRLRVIGGQTHAIPSG